MFSSRTWLLLQEKSCSRHQMEENSDQQDEEAADEPPPTVTHVSDGHQHLWCSADASVEAPDVGVILVKRRDLKMSVFSMNFS